jgi:hypothetical protein
VTIIVSIASWGSPHRGGQRQKPKLLEYDDALNYKMKIAISKKNQHFLLKSLVVLPNINKNNAQVGIRIRVVWVTGKHDWARHYLGSRLNKCPASRIRTGDIAVAAQLPIPVNHTTAAHSTELS